MRTLVAILAALVLVAPVEAQDVTLGDKVRYRTDADSAWVEGKLMAVEDSTLSVAVGTRELHARLSEVQKAQRWEPTNPAVHLLTATAGGAAGMATTGLFASEEDKDDCEFDGPDCPWLTGSGAGDLGLGAGFGLVGGLVLWAIDQGDWKDWSVSAP